MISYITVKEGPVDIYDLRSRYLGEMKTSEGFMLPNFIYRNKTFFVTDFKPTANDQWIMNLTNEHGLVTSIRIPSNGLVSNGTVLFLAEERKVYHAQEYYDYWTTREGKPAPFFYESRQYHVKSFVHIPGSTELWITAEREKGHWYTFRLSDSQKSKFTRYATTNEKGHQIHDWVLENVEWTLDTIRYF